MKLIQKYTIEEQKRLFDIKKKIEILQQEYQQTADEIIKSHNLIPAGTKVYYYYCNNWRREELNSVRLAYIEKWSNHDAYCMAKLSMINQDGSVGNCINTINQCFGTFGGVVAEIEPMTETMEEARNIIKQIKKDLKRDKTVKA